MSQSTSLKPLKRRDLCNYSLLALPLAFVGIPLYIHAPDFYTAHHGLSLTSLAAILLGLRIFDAVQDPIIGYLSDKYSKNRYGFMLSALIAVVIGFWALFSPVESYLALWFAITMLIATTAFSVLSINLNALGALWSSHRAQQSRITSLREGLAIVGLILAVTIPPLLSTYMPVGDAFQFSALLLAFFSLIAFWRFSLWKKRHKNLFKRVKQKKERFNIVATFLSNSEAIKQFYGVYALSMLASAIPMVLVLFFIRDLLNAEALSGYFLLSYFLSGLLALPLWKGLSNLYSPAHAWFLAMCVSIIGFAGAFMLGAGDITAYFIICILTGSALGADMALPPAILALHMHQSSNQNRISSQFSILAFLSKSSLAIAGMLVLPALDYVGFVPAAENSSRALLSLSVAYALVPIVIKLLAMAVLWRHLSYFSITQKEKNPHENTEESNLNHLDRSHYHA